MFDSEDVVFAWAIGKALVIVIVSVGALVYIAWLATRTKEIALVGIPENALSSSAVKASNVPPMGSVKIEALEGPLPIVSRISAEANHTRMPEQPTVAA